MSFMNAAHYAFTIMARPHFMRVSFTSGGVVATSVSGVCSTSDRIRVHLPLCAFVELVGIIDVIIVVIVAWWGVYADPTSVS
jgi:hypothetical protein